MLKTAVLLQENYRGYSLIIKAEKNRFCFEWQDNQGNEFSDSRYYASPDKAILAGRRYINHAVAEMAILDFLDDMLDTKKISGEEYFRLWDSLI